MDDKKKDAQIAIRVPADIKDIIRRLADEDRRVISWMTRELVIEALEYRGLVARRTGGKSAKKGKRRG